MKIDFYDHGDADVDESWHRILGLDSNPLERHASLGGAIPPEDASYVPPEYVNAGRIPDSWFICMDILAATEAAEDPSG